MPDLQLIVVRLTEPDPVSWSDLGREAGMEVVLRSAEEDPVASEATAAVVLGAGHDCEPALAWLDVHAARRDVPVIVVGQDRSHRLAARTVRRGAADYFVLPEDLESLLNTLEVAARNRRRALAGAGSGAPVGAAFQAVVGRSPALRDVLARAERIAGYRDATAVLLGETGTGKEVLARAIHEGGPRRNAPFVAVNCSGIPGPLFESELFGYQRGAFTDASQEKPGLFEIADGGTIFFDELGLLPLELQSKLLRVLEDRRVRRLGSTRDRRVDVRILAATNEDLGRATREGAVRRDFFYRIGSLQLELPPLRDRGEDVLLIADVLLTQLAEQHGVPAPALTPDVRRRLLRHSWPGNVRELRNALERALLLSPPGELAPAELALGSSGAGSAPGPAGGSPPFPSTLQELTAWAAREMLERCAGNRSEAARRLGISRARLRRLLPEEDPPRPTRKENP